MTCFASDCIASGTEEEFDGDWPGSYWCKSPWLQVNSVDRGCLFGVTEHWQDGCYVSDSREQPRYDRPR
jgi:hypothetical protein